MSILIGEWAGLGLFLKPQIGFGPRLGFVITRPAYNIPIKPLINISLYFQDSLIFSNEETFFFLFLILTLGLCGVDFSHRDRAHKQNHTHCNGSQA